jgi:M6 family metalloprotease-like protein
MNRGYRWLFPGILLVTSLTFAAPLNFVPQRLTQPDGSVLNCFASGDEYYNWLHDANGYTIVRDGTTGYYVYAVLVKGNLIPTSAVAGKADPVGLGIHPWLSVAPAVMEGKRNQLLASTPGPVINAPTLGSFTNLAVFIRFADEAEWTSQFATYNLMFNDDVAGKSSLYNYYREVSYGAVSIITKLYPDPGTAPIPGTTVISFQDVHPRAYYRPYNAATADSIGYQGGDNGSERTSREHALLKAAIDSIGKLIPSNLNFDADNDGYVDNVVFIVSGSPTGWSSLLWPHAWSLYSVTATVNGKRVYRYNLQLQSSINVGVLCHEMYHTLGAPDLYHYSKPLTPVGGWDIMATSTSTPMHMGAYMKFKYGHWIPTLPTISSPGRYTLSPVTSSTNNIYKISSPYSTTEYFVLEYRKKAGVFEPSLPGEGLVVYRINSAVGGNASGPPDELYIYRPGGTLSADGSLGSAAFSSEASRVVINDQTDPGPFLSGGGPGGLSISAVGTRGDTIGFTLGPPVPAVIDSFTAVYIRADSIAVSWVAKAQYRNRTFELERSDSALSGFAAFAGNGIPGGGTTATSRGYSFADRTNPGKKFYRIKEIDSSGAATYSNKIAQASFPTAIAAESVIPQSFMLEQNYPNPFNPETVVSFQLSAVSDVRLMVYDILGQEVATLVNERKTAGRHEVKFDGSSLSSGIYFYRLAAGNQIQTRKMILTK